MPLQGQTLDAQTVKGNDIDSDGDGTVNSADDGVPSGSIFWVVDDGSSLPTGYVLCDGTNGTPDLRNRYIKGASGTGDEGTTGGANTVILTEAELASHKHDLTDSDGDDTRSGGVDKASNGVSETGDTETSGSDSAHQNEPQFYELRAVMKT